MELDPETGMLKAGSGINAEGDGYGRRLLGNAHVSVEAPYIIHSPETDLYYLFVSYGWLEAGGGYQMRVFRSRNVDGPYEDAANPDINFAGESWFTNHANYGVKIMGGYRFSPLRGESISTGFLSPGHNSVHYEAETGRYFLIYHQRFEGRGEFHEGRVAEMFLNEDGWFGVSPFRFDGGVIRDFVPSNIPGSWKLINHGRDINTAPALSQTYRFMEDGSIAGPGGSGGTWLLGDNGKTAYITVDGVLHKGVFLRSFDEDGRAWVMAFTALSRDGIALWGAGAAGRR
jgi:arabinan endo-1,5-alpha-L-arabinosidase